MSIQGRGKHTHRGGWGLTGVSTPTKRGGNCQYFLHLSVLNILVPETTCTMFKCYWLEKKAKLGHSQIQGTSGEILDLQLKAVVISTPYSSLRSHPNYQLIHCSDSIMGHLTSCFLPTLLGSECSSELAQDLGHHSYCLPSCFRLLR